MNQKKLFTKKPGINVEADRVFDVTDERWAHPEVVNPWFTPVEGPSYDLFNPDIPIEQKQAMGPAIQKIMDDLFTTWPHTCKIDHYVAPGCPEEPNAMVDIYVFTPSNLKREKKNPCIFEIAGGGIVLWCGHGIPMDNLCEELQAVGVMMRYRLSWEAPYPAAINDIHAAYQWTVENADLIGISPDKIVVNGASSGAHLALASCFRLARYGHRPRGVVAIVPQTDDRIGQTEALYTGWWDTFEQQDALHSWLGNRQYASAAIGPEALPNRASVEDFLTYPPCFIHTAEFDPDADANREFYGKCKAAHTYCEYHAWGGSLHTNSTWNYWELAGEPNEYSELVKAVSLKNMRDCLTYDLRRSWRYENDE